MSILSPDSALCQIAKAPSDNCGLNRSTIKSSSLSQGLRSNCLRRSPVMQRGVPVRKDRDCAHPEQAQKAVVRFGSFSVPPRESARNRAQPMVRGVLIDRRFPRPPRGAPVRYGIVASLARYHPPAQGRALASFRGHWLRTERQRSSNKSHDRCAVVWSLRNDCFPHAARAAGRLGPLPRSQNSTTGPAM